MEPDKQQSGDEGEGSRLVKFRGGGPLWEKRLKSFRRRNLLAVTTYSKNLLKPDATVYLHWLWNKFSLTVQAAEDAANVDTLCALITEYMESNDVKPYSLDRVPEEGEMVIAKYEDNWYRGVITAHDGNIEEYNVLFVDFGDSSTYSWKELYEIPRHIFRIPIYGIKIIFHRLRYSFPVDFEYRQELTDELQTQPFLLELLVPVASVRPNYLALEFPACLWRLGKQVSFNELAVAAINDWNCNWIDPPEEERNEIESLMSSNEFFKSTVDFVRQYNEEIFVEKNDRHRRFVFRLDNADYEYFSPEDLPYIRPELLSNSVEVEITKYSHLSKIQVRLVGKKEEPQFDFEEALASRCAEIGKWVAERSAADRARLQDGFVPERNRVCLVFWPEKWGDVYYSSSNFRPLDSSYLDWLFEGEPVLDVFNEDYKSFGGKWYRAVCRKPVKPPEDETETSLYEMFLLDIGKTTLVETKNIFPMPHRFNHLTPLSFRLSLRLDDVTQYSEELEQKWKYLLHVGMRMKIKVFWMYFETVFASLDDPSQSQMEQHYSHYYVQQAIEKHEARQEDKRIHNKVKSMAKIKGTYPRYLELVKQEEAKEKKLEPFRKQFEGIGKVHPDRVFFLRKTNHTREEIMEKRKYQIVHN